MKYTEKLTDNLGRIVFDGDGKYNIPYIKGCASIPDNWIGFNFALSTPEFARYDKGIHFFLDDYQFIRCWNRPGDYIRCLNQYGAVCSPDFSLYSNYPVVMQIYNHYRKHWLGAYWEYCGINVIPTISWSDEKSFEWCFDGEPQNSIVAVSTVGTQINDETKKNFIKGYNEMLKRLKPRKIIMHGAIPEECDGDIIAIPSHAMKFKEKESA